MVKRIFLFLLRYVLPLALGIFLIWLSFRKLTDEDIDSIKNAFRDADYFWIWISVFLGVLSHISRAYRWKFTLEPLGYKPRFLNSFMAVMIGYLVNMGVPRMGEVSRAAALARYEGIPFNKGFGTIIAERVADLIFLLGFIVAVVLIQLHVLQSYILAILDQFDAVKIALILAVLGGLGLLFLRFIQRSEIPLFAKLRAFVLGLLEGVKSILKMKKSGAFIAHTLFIWLMYFLMFYLAMNAVSSLKDVPLGGGVSGFAIGGISIAVTNGGIGAYPYGVMQILQLYGVSAVYGLAFGWIIWTAQVALNVLLGVLSFIFMPIYNRSTPHEEPNVKNTF
jgi:uncharacterized protein (TIRG00374 family)